MKLWQHDGKIGIDGGGFWRRVSSYGMMAKLKIYSIKIQNQSVSRMTRGSMKKNAVLLWVVYFFKLDGFPGVLYSLYVRDQVLLQMPT